MKPRITLEEKAWLEVNSHLPISDIAKYTGRNKSTIQGWLKTIGVENRSESKDERRLIKLSRMQKNVEDKHLKILKEIEEFYTINKNNPDFLAGIALYWAEGTKGDYTFTNSDPRMIIFMTHWMRAYLRPPILYLRFHVLPEYENDALNHWKSILKGDLCADIRISKTKPVKTEMGIMQINARGLKDAKLTISKLIELYNNDLTKYVSVAQSVEHSPEE